LGNGSFISRRLFLWWNWFLKNKRAKKRLGYIHRPKSRCYKPTFDILADQPTILSLMITGK
jgi:hypothetical protein